MTVTSLHDKFVYELQQAYYIETELVDILEGMAQETADEEISEGFRKHQRETAEQARRLEDAFESLGEAVDMRQCYALDGLVEDHNEFLDEAADDEDLIDLYNLGAGIKVERLEISIYEGLLNHADRLDLSNDVTDPLDDNLDEEEATLKELNGTMSGSTIQQLLGRLTG
ncbi:MAG: ferritin-like domain-containing protein [Halohasta sp.]